MALTLPYPGLVFVPLDILTAEEQNEIVANYTYIANQFPISASNIDFSTIGSTCVTNTNQFTSNENWTTRLSTTVPSGTYIVHGYCTFKNNTTTASGESNIRFSYGSSNSPIFTSFLGDTQYSSTTTCGFALIQLSTSGSINLQTAVNWPQRGTYTTAANQCGLSVIRVA